MTKKEQFVYRTVSDFIQGKLSRKQAALILEMRERSVSRIARRIEKKNFFGVVHGNRSKKPANKFNDEIKKAILCTLKDKYYDFNMSHALEYLKNNNKFKLSYSTFRRWCHEEKLVKNEYRRSSVIRNKRVRMPSEGLLLQMDGSHHKWNGRDKWCLITVIDDATSKIPYSEFFLSEDTLNCMTVMQNIIERNGIPYSLYVDRAGIFGGTKRDNFGQFQRACDELNIKVIFAHSPQAKGRIERTFRTFQDRLIPEMRVRNIKKMPYANDYLQKQFIANYWNIHNTVTPQNLEVKYQPLPKHLDLQQIFCIKEYRTVRNDNTVVIDNKFYQVQTKMKHPLYRQKIEIRTYQNLTQKVFFAGEEIQLVEIDSQILKQAA